MFDTNQNERRWLSIQETAAYLGVSPQTIRNVLRRGELRAAQLTENGPYFIDRLDIDRLVERRKRILPAYRKGSRPWVAKRWARQRQA